MYTSSMTLGFQISTRGKDPENSCTTQRGWFVRLQQEQNNQSWLEKYSNKIYAELGKKPCDKSKSICTKT